jgi:hypothetical protein
VGFVGLLLLGGSIVVCAMSIWIVGLMVGWFGWSVGRLSGSPINFAPFYVGGAPMRKERPGSDAVSSVQVTLACDRVDDK